MAPTSSQPSGESSASSLLAAVLSTTSSVVAPSSVTQQVSRSEVSQGAASQYEHVTVMTHLQQPAKPDTRTQCAVRCSLEASTSSYAESAPAMGALHVHAPSAITQQVQLSVPAIAASSLPNPSFRVVTHRAPSYRSGVSRAHKTSLSTMLPMMGRGSVKQLANMAVIGDDGPTVRQHLQQQQQKAKLQQQLALQAKHDAQQAPGCDQPRNIKGEANEVSQSVILRDTVMSTTRTKSTGGLSGVQRPYVPRLSTAERQRAAAEAVRQLQLQDNNESAQRLQRSQSQPTNMLNTLGSFQTSSANVTPTFMQTTMQQRMPLQVSQAEQRTDHLPTTVSDTQNRALLPAKRTLLRKRSQRPVSQVHVTMLSPTPNQPLAATQQVVGDNERPFPLQAPEGAMPEVSGQRISQDGMQSASAPEAQSQFLAQPARQQAISPQHFPQATEGPEPDLVEQQKQQSGLVRRPQKALVVSSGASSTVVTERHGSSVVVTHQKPVAPVAGHFVHPHTVQSGICTQTMGSTALRQRIARLPPHVLRQKQEEQMYLRKSYFLKRTIKALVFKNGALCDEVARLNQRIQTVTDERKMLAKRLQHYERNRIRRIQTKMKKAAALAAKMSAFQAAPMSLSVEMEVESLEARNEANDMEDNENESEKSRSSSCSPSPITSNSASRVATPESMRPMEPGITTTPSTQSNRKYKWKSRKSERQPTRSAARKAKRNTPT